MIRPKPSLHSFKRIACLVATFGLFLSTTAIGQKRPMVPDDLCSMNRIGSFALSPDGQWVVYAATQFDAGQDQPNRDLFLISALGGNPRPLTTHPASDDFPCWSPDGLMVAFLSTRNGTPQICAIRVNGGEALPLSAVPGGVSDFLWSPDGTTFAFTSPVKNEDPSGFRHEPGDGSGSPVLIIEQPFFRYRDAWRDRFSNQLFVMPSTGGSAHKVGDGRFEVPPIHARGRRSFSFSPDGREIAFVSQEDSLPAFSTNTDIFFTPTTGSRRIRKITDNPAADHSPVYSPDGKSIAYLAADHAGSASDQTDLILFDRKTKLRKNMTMEFDLDVKEMAWNPASDLIYFTSQDQGRIVVFMLDVKSGKIKGLVFTGCSTDLVVSPDDNSLFFRRSHIQLPWEIFRYDQPNESTYQLTASNTDRLESLQLSPLVDFWYPSFDGKIIHGMLVRPPSFNSSKTYPGVFLIHDGPEDAWQDEFHDLWNAQIFASRGNVVVMVNFRGSRGYGQEFCNAASKNWGGVPYRDLMIGVDYILAKYPFIDPKRLAAAGGGYGGYLVDWIAGHTDRFQCLVSHAGISDPASFYGTTDEPWFPEWEFDGTPYDNPRLYERWAPLKFTENLSTPMLLTHGAADTRVSLDQSIQMFTALQKRHVPSRLVVFQDEGHEIRQCRNIALWWKNILDWIDQWTPPPPVPSTE